MSHWDLEIWRRRSVMPLPPRCRKEASWVIGGVVGGVGLKVARITAMGITVGGLEVMTG